MFCMNKSLDFYFEANKDIHCTKSLQDYFSYDHFKRSDCAPPASDHMAKGLAFDEAPQAICLLADIAQLPQSILSFSISGRELTCYQ